MHATSMTLPTTLDGVVRALDGGVHVAGAWNPHIAIEGVSTDTRSLAPGDLFVALDGATHRGSRFVPEAFARGAAAVVMDDAASVDAPPDRPVLRVASPLRALSRIASEHRRGLRAQVVAITGSVGKTSTREMLRHLLEGAGEVVSAERSFNNAVGVPLTLLRARASARYLLVEIGTSAPGEVASLARLARADLALVTRVAAAHLEGLGDIDGVAREKAALVENLDAQTGLAVLNADDARVAAMAGRGGAGSVLFGRAPSAQVRGVAWIEGESTRLQVTVGRAPSFTVALPFRSVAHAQNALAALACAHGLGLDVAALAPRLEEARLPDRRLQPRAIGGGITVIDDAYNASPASVAAALDTLACEPGRKAFVFGSMLELGATSERLHAAVAEQAAEAGVDLLVCVGPLAAHAGVEAARCGLAAVCVDGPVDAVDALDAWLEAGDTVLVKASRGARLERVVEGLAERRGPAA